MQCHLSHPIREGSREIHQSSELLLTIVYGCNEAIMKRIKTSWLRNPQPFSIARLGRPFTEAATNQRILALAYLASYHSSSSLVCCKTRAIESLRLPGNWFFPPRPNSVTGWNYALECCEALPLRDRARTVITNSNLSRAIWLPNEHSQSLRRTISTGRCLRNTIVAVE
jgi:hypothetical protein